MVNWQLSRQAIRWPVSLDHIAGSGLELIEVACFLKVDRWPLLLVYRLDRGLKSRYFSEGRSTRKGKILAQSNPWRVVDFLLTYSFHNPLLERPWYIAYVISIILVRLVGYSLLKFNWKKIAKPHAEQLHTHNWSFFEFLIQEKLIPFSRLVSYCNQKLRF